MCLQLLSLAFQDEGVEFFLIHFAHLSVKVIFDSTDRVAFGLLLSLEQLFFLERLVLENFEKSLSLYLFLR